MSKPLRTLVVGCGHMGTAHALAYHSIPDYQVVGVVSRGAPSRMALADKLGGVPDFSDFEDALARAEPDVVCVATYTETHAEYAQWAMQMGCHVFVEKPLALNVEQAADIVAKAQQHGRKLVVGYILRQHPSWIKFIEIARSLGKPLVMRMNLNQQSSGHEWDVHRNLMNDMSPIVDCGVHYVDVMCQMVQAKPIRVHGIGARLSDELKPGMYNYGQLHVAFEDGSCGWYEAGWGPMMSEEACFVKDVIGPRGACSIVASKAAASDDVDAHTRTNTIRIHHGALDADGKFAKPDELVDMSDEPDHLELCRREQLYLLKAIRQDLDLTSHLEDAVNSLRIVIAADESARSGEAVDLR